MFSGFVSSVITMVWASSPEPIVYCYMAKVPTIWICVDAVGTKMVMS